MCEVICLNEKSARYLEGLPTDARCAIAREQQEILRILRAVYPPAFCTSGFRCPSYSVSVGGSPDSRHFWGALDFRPTPNFPRSVPGLVIEWHEKGTAPHWHVYRER